MTAAEVAEIGIDGVSLEHRAALREARYVMGWQVCIVLRTARVSCLVSRVSCLVSRVS